MNPGRQDEGPDPADPEPETRTGYVALAGPPNAGKSTLLNALVGQKLSIATPRAQTTWHRVTGIRTDDGSQMIFLDTPGLLSPRGLLQRSLLEGARGAMADSDVIVAVLDAERPPDDRRRRAVKEVLEGAPVPVVAAVNKADIAAPGRVTEESEWAREELDAEPLPVSALTGTGLRELLDLLRSHLPAGPFLFPEDDVATEPIRFFVAELVREAVFRNFREEVPYSVMPRVEEFRDEPSRTYILVHLYVERRSQKGILLGRNGTAIRGLGEDARKAIEAFLDTPVYLDLWVKVLPGWRKKRSQLLRFGFQVPPDEEQE